MPRPFSTYPPRYPLTASKIDRHPLLAEVDVVWVDLGESVGPRAIRSVEQVFLGGTMRAVVVPFWALVVLFAAYPAVALVRGPLTHLARRRCGLCSRCGYNLTGTLEAKCPECGREFDRARQQRNRQRWESKARRAALWYHRYRAARLRRTVAAACLPVFVVTGLLWLVGCWRITWKAPAFSCTVARGHLIIISQPMPVTGSADGSSDGRWSSGGFEGCSPIWRPYPLREGATLYVPCWSLMACSAVLWLFAYRPFYRLRWSRVVDCVDLSTS